jgi:hypothetical protein
VRGKTIRLKSNLKYQTFDNLSASEAYDAVMDTPIDGAFD